MEKRYPRCIMSTCCVPWDEQGNFAEEIFRREVRATLSEGTKHQYVFGTAGEGYAVTDAQFDRIVQAFADEMRRGAAEPMVGIIHLSLATMIERIERCRDWGIREYQISLPSWGALNERELFDFFRRVCGRFRDCRFLHYNLPRTKRIVTAQEYARLAKEHPNLVATKNSNDSMTFTGQLLELAPELQHFLNETGFIYGSLLGECGLLASLVASWPKLHRLFAAAVARDLPTLMTLQREINLYNRLGDFLGDSVHIDGAYDKMTARLIDPEFPLRLLPPYVCVSEEQFQQYERALRQELPQWLPAQK